MSSIASDPVLSAIRVWEEAQSFLSSALANYLDSCLSLNAVLRRDYPKAGSIASRIDSALDTLHPATGLQLARSTSTLAQTRNLLNSSLGCLPEEVLYQIFLEVVYAPKNMKLPMRTCVRAMYRDLHNLLAVCSTWRSIGISRGGLWETIPAIDVPIRSQAVDLSLQRSRGRTLHLAATTTLDGPPTLIKTVVENVSRLRTLNIQGPFSSRIISIIIKLLRNGVPNQLSGLFLHRSPTKYSQPLRPSNYVVEANSAEQSLFNKLISSLAVIRLSGIQVHWRTTTSTFSDRLVEFCIHKVALGDSDSAMATFVLALSSASALRDLKIIGVRVYHNPTESVNPTMRPPVIFPKLRSLLLRDLCFHPLEFFLLAIAPGPYHLTLALSEAAPNVYYSDGRSEKVGLDDVVGLLALVRVDTLILPRGKDKAWLQGPGLRKLLGSIPRLKVLKMHGWHFYEEFFNGLCPAPSTEQSSYVFSHIEVLQLTRARIRDQEGFKHMLAVLSPVTIILSGYIETEDKKWTQLTEDDDVVDWLVTNVPGFRLVSLKYGAEAPEPDSWQLW